MGAKQKQYMIGLMADIIAPCEEFHGGGLNDPAVWERFMAAVFQALDAVEDDDVRETLSVVDKREFQTWIDSPDFWDAINDEIERRGQVVQTFLPSAFEGRC